MGDQAESMNHGPSSFPEKILFYNYFQPAQRYYNKKLGISIIPHTKDALCCKEMVAMIEYVQT